MHPSRKRPQLSGGGSDADVVVINSCRTVFSFVFAVPAVMDVVDFEYLFSPTVVYLHGVFLDENAHWHEKVVDAVMVGAEGIGDKEAECYGNTNLV